MAYVWELAAVERGKEPPVEVTLDPGDPNRPVCAPQPWPTYELGHDYFEPIPPGNVMGLKAYEGVPGTSLWAAADSVAARFGVTRSILQQAGKETRDRLTAELSTMMTVCTFIGGFIFTTLVDPGDTGSGFAGPASSNRTTITLQTNVTGVTQRYYSGVSTFNFSDTQTNSTETPLAAGGPVGSLDLLSSWDAYGVMAGLTLVMALTCVGIYARLLVLLQWAATTTSLYRLIANWERAMSANQLMFFGVLTLSYASALAACWGRYGGGHGPPSGRRVFLVLLVATVVFWYFFANFWARSMWWRDDGIMQGHARLYPLPFTILPK
jgi:hypothetical protein